MPLKACRECGKEVSTEAQSCPHCGAAAPAGKPVVDTSIGGNARSCLGCLLWPVIILIILLVVVMMFGCSDTPTEADPYPPLPSPAQFEGSWEYRGTFSQDYPCTSDECHFFVETDSGSVEVLGFAHLHTGSSTVGTFEQISSDTTSAGIALDHFTAPLAVTGVAVERCESTGRVLVVCQDAQIRPAPSPSAMVQLRVAREIGADPEVVLQVEYDGDQIFDGTLRPLSSDTLATDTVATQDDGVGWAFFRP